METTPLIRPAAPGTTPPLTHLLYWSLPILTALPLWGAWLDFSWVLEQNGPPDPYISDKYSITFMTLASGLGPYVAAALLIAVVLCVGLWNTAPAIRVRVLVWITLLIGSTLVYDNRQPTGTWMLRASAEFILVVLATVLPVLWSLLLLRKRLQTVRLHRSGRSMVGQKPRLSAPPP